MSGSALMAPATFATSATAVGAVKPSGVWTRATMPPSARTPLALCSRATATVDCDVGSWKPPTWSDFATGPPKMPPIAANAIATPTITHGARLIKRANPSKIISLNPTNSEASPRVRGGPVIFFIFLARLQVLCQLPKPIRAPVVERDPELHDLVVHAMRLCRSHRFVLSKPGRDLLVAPAHRLEMRDRLLLRHRVGEEELEQHLVADLQALDRRICHPAVQRLLALRGEVIEGALARALRYVLRFDQIGLGEPFQLGID